MNRTLIIIASVLTTVHCHSQTTVTLQASRDAAIGFHDGANTAGNNYGSASQNAAFWIPSVAQSNGENGNRALIDFSLASIPAGATLVSAYINLYALSPHGSLPGHTGTANASYLQRITQNWGEFTVTWLNQPGSTTLNQVTLPQSASVSQDYTMVNVTQLVHDMRNNPSSSFGFLLKLVNETVTNAMIFGSKDHSDPTKRPTLVVTYSTGSPLGVPGSEETDQQPPIVYPNPVVGGLVRIRTKCQGRFCLDSGIGNRVYDAAIEEQDQMIDIRCMPPGVYFYRIIEHDGTSFGGRLLIAGDGQH